MGVQPPSSFSSSTAHTLLVATIVLLCVLLCTQQWLFSTNLGALLQNHQTQYKQLTDLLKASLQAQSSSSGKQCSSAGE